MNLALDTVGVTDDLDPSLDALPVKHARGVLDLAGEKVERLRRDRTTCCLESQCPGYVCAAVKLFLWVFQSITC